MTTPTPTDPAPPPSLVEVRDWLKVSTDQVSEHDLEVIRLAEIGNQASECRVPVTDPPGLLPAPLVASIYRRCARAVAARGIPLGYRSGDDEYGPVRLPSYDAEISRLEGPLRRFAFG